MKTITTISAGILALIGGAAVAETYVIDPGHTEILFKWNHAGLTTQSGEWTRISGEIEFDPENVTATTARVEIDANSLHTGVPELDKHLKAEDFFDVSANPTITFASTRAVQTGAENLRLIGDITVKGTTVPAELDVALVFQGEHPLGSYLDFYKGDWIGVEATGNVLRSELGVGQYAPLTSDVVQLEISSEMRAGGWPEQ